MFICIDTIKVKWIQIYLCNDNDNPVWDYFKPSFFLEAISTLNKYTFKKDIIGNIIILSTVAG